MKVIIDIRLKELDKYPYKTTKLGKLYFPRVDPEQEETKNWDAFGVTDSYFGGNIHKIADIKDKPYSIIVSRNDETLGIIHRFDRLGLYDKKDLQSLCDLQKVEYTEKDNKQTLIDKLTELQS